MKYTTYLLFLSLFIATGCNNNNNKTASDETVVDKKAKDDGTPGDFYMRLSGTLGDKPIVLNLHKYGPQVAGYYEYLGTGRPIKLTNNEDTLLTDGEHYLTEQSDGMQLQQDATPHWDIKVSGNKVTGKWTSADRKTTNNIELKEEYPQGSIALSADYFTDTAMMWKTLAYPKADVAYGIVWPHEGDKSEGAAFLRSAISSGVQLESVVGAFTSLKTRAWRYFGNYRLDIKKVLDSTASEEKRKGFDYHYSSTFHHYVLYNDQNWFILESAISNYTGGVHGIYGMTYQNLDLSASKAWTLKEIITDTSALQPLLNAAARARFGLPEGGALDRKLLVGEVPVTNNFYLNSSGLTFVYNPYDIASYADGVIALFIPYSRLLPMLTPAFRKRADLDEQSGAL